MTIFFIVIAVKPSDLTNVKLVHKPTKSLDFSNDLILPAALFLRPSKLVREKSKRNLPGVEGWLVRKANILIIIIIIIIIIRKPIMTASTPQKPVSF
jgi:hypothetical protein